MSCDCWVQWQARAQMQWPPHALAGGGCDVVADGADSDAAPGGGWDTVACWGAMAGIHSDDSDAVAGGGFDAVVGGGWDALGGGRHYGGLSFCYSCQTDTAKHTSSKQSGRGSIAVHCLIANQLEGRIL